MLHAQQPQEWQTLIPDVKLNFVLFLSPSVDRYEQFGIWTYVGASTLPYSSDDISCSYC